MTALTTLTQDGRLIEGLRSFAPEPPQARIRDEIDARIALRRVRVGLVRYSIDNHDEPSEFVLDAQGQHTIRFRAFFGGYEFHPATGLFAILEIEGEPEYTEAAP